MRPFSVGNGPLPLQIGPSQTWGKLYPWAQNLTSRERETRGGRGGKAQVQICWRSGRNMPASQVGPALLALPPFIHFQQLSSRTKKVIWPPRIANASLSPQSEISEQQKKSGGNPDDDVLSEKFSFDIHFHLGLLSPV